ncbi:MAG: glycosyltransferase family 2 protein [Phycisphaerales bacterium]
MSVVPASSVPMRFVPRVTVVVIVRNGERFLGEALESIVAQRFDGWEVVVVDDGSSDGSRAVAEAFASRMPERFRVATHDGGANLGMSASRNLGIALARGELVTFLDHDDAMLPEKLGRQVALLDAHADAAAVVGPNLRWLWWHEGAPDDEPQDLGTNGRTLLEPPGLLPVFLTRTSATPQAPMVRREAILAVGGFDDEFRDMYEDQVFLAKLFLDHRVLVIDEVLQRYRQHDDSCVRRAHRERRHLHARARFLRWLAARPGLPRGLADLVARERRRTFWARLRTALRVR